MPKATNICAGEAGEIKYLPNNTVMISINQEYEPLFRLKLDRNSSKILTLQFNDITAPHDIFKPMTPEQGLKILDFININKGKDFIIHCAAGVSRSAAICLYLNIMEGYELKKDFWKISRPNPFILGRLMVLRKKY